MTTQSYTTACSNEIRPAAWQPPDRYRRLQLANCAFLTVAVFDVAGVPNVQIALSELRFMLFCA